jgi:hypothetical protein
VPGTEDFLINPFGLMFHEITASSLVKVDQAGNKLMDSPYEINPAGYTIHSAIHEVRHDVTCVLHTHTAAGVAVSAQKQGVLPISQQSMFVLSSLAYHAYEGVALNHEEKARLQADLAKNFPDAAQPRSADLRRHHRRHLPDDVHLPARLRHPGLAQGGGAELIAIDRRFWRGQGDDRRRHQKRARHGRCVGLAGAAAQTR